jgi:hypothetical protein
LAHVGSFFWTSKKESEKNIESQQFNLKNYFLLDSLNCRRYLYFLRETKSRKTAEIIAIPGIGRVGAIAPLKGNVVI